MHNIELLSFLLRVQTRFPNLNWEISVFSKSVKALICLKGKMLDAIHINIHPRLCYLDSYENTVVEIRYKSEYSHSCLKLWTATEEKVFDFLEDWLNEMCVALLKVSKS